MLLRDGAPLNDLPRRTLAQARRISQGVAGDDCTAALASCRPGSMVTLLTGPPEDKAQDQGVVKRFLLMDSVKIVSGEHHGADRGARSAAR